MTNPLGRSMTGMTTHCRAPMSCLTSPTVTNLRGKDSPGTPGGDDRRSGEGDAEHSSRGRPGRGKWVQAVVSPASARLT
ncbi:hypothetical protein GCM10027456_04390 [Kineosporia babensis]